MMMDEKYWELLKEIEALRNKISEMEKAGSGVGKVEKKKNVAKAKSSTELLNTNGQTEPHHESGNFLAEAGNKFKTFFNTNPSATFVWENVGDDFVLIEVNEAAQELTTNNASKFIGLSATSIYDDSPQMIGKLNECFSKRTIISFEEYYQNRNKGTWTWISFRMAFLAPNLVILYADDISERKAVEQKLIENDKLLRMIAENYPNSYISIIEKDLTCGYSAGQEFKKQNLDPNSFNGLSLKEIFGELEPVVKKHYLLTFGGQKQSFELFINNQHQLYYTVPLVDENGAIDRILVVVENITDRKQAIEEAKKSKERMELIIKGSKDAAWDWNFADHSIYYSPQWWQQIGYKPDEMPADDQLWYRLLHPEDKPNVDKQLQLALNGDLQSYEMEFRLKHKKGHFVPVLSRGIITRDDSGKVVRLSGTNMDLSERKKTESELREAKETAERYLEMSGNMFISLDVNGNIVLINQKGLEILEYTKEELLGKNWFETCLPGEIKDEIKDVFSKVISGILEGVEKYENDIVTKSGKHKTIAWYNSYLLSNTGTIEYLFSSGIDITEVIETQAELKESQKRYQNFIQNSGEGIYRIEMKEPVPVDLPKEELIRALDENAYVAEANKALADMYGLQVEEMIGKPATDFAPDHGMRALMVIESKDHILHESYTQDVDKDGNVIHLSENCHGEIEDGKLLRIWGVQRNITELQKMQNRLLESQERFNLAMKASKDGVFDWNLVTNEIYYSPAWKSMLGYDYDELPNDFSVWETLTESEDVKKSWEMQRQHIAGQRARFEMEFKMKHKDGHWVDILSRANAVFDAKGKAIRFVGTHQDISERKQSEKKLLESEERFRKMIEFMPNGVLILKPINNADDFEFIEVNKHAEKLTKAAKHDLIGSTLIHKIANINESPLIKGLRQVSKTGEDLYIPPFYYKDDIREGWREAYLYMLESGEIVLIVKDVTDIQNASRQLQKQNAELKLAIQKAEESEARFKALHNASFGGIAIHNKGIILDCNLGLSEISGYTQDELIGMDGLLLIAENFRQLVMGNILSEYEKPYEAFGLRKNGEVYPLRLEARMIPYKGSKVRVVEFRDIGEQRKAREELVQSEKKYRNIFESIQDTFYEATLDGIILEISPSVNELSKGNFSREQLIGKQILSLYDNPEQRDAFLKILLQQGKVSDYELTLKNTTGETAICSVSSKIVFDEKGNAEKIIGSLRDISERKKVEEELLVAKEKAEESDRLKSAFLANMSHEIRTPMNGILGFADLLKEPGLSGDEQLQYLNVIEKSGERMLNIINDLIDISKIEAGQMEVKISKTRLRDQAEYLCTFFKPEMEKKGLDLITDFPLEGEHSDFYTDREKLYAIITNLFKNAIKYTNEGSIEFGFSLVKSGGKKLTEPNNLCAQFYLKDTGIGIPPDRINAIFERFIQADIEDKKAMEGAGLGLAISKAYVEMLGGKIWVESENGKGSTFYFTIPDKGKGLQNHEMEKPVIQRSAVEPKKRLKILVAEDDDTSEIHLSIVLQNFASEIIYAHTGTEAVELSRQNPDIDLILMDIKMPEMNGYNATREIRKFNKKAVIIAQTAYALTGDREKALDAGCNDYITKPVKKEWLMSIIEKHFA